MPENKYNPIQVEGYRRLGGEQRVRIAFELSAMVRAVAREGIKQQHPEFSEEEIAAELQRRIDYGRTATHRSRR